MSIFNRKDRSDPEGSIPGRWENDRLERDMGELLRAAEKNPKAEAAFSPAPTLDQRRERLDFHLTEFAKHYDAARREAQYYLAEHEAMVKELEAEKAKVEKHLRNLEDIANALPTFGGKDEPDQIVISGPSPGGDDDIASPSRVVKDPVPTGSIQSLRKPLPLDRR